MKLTKTQLNELLNQLTGTGYLLVKLDNKTVRISDVSRGRNGTWRIGLDGRPLEQGLKDIEHDLVDDD